MERRFGQRVETNVELDCRVPATPVRAVMHDLSPTGCRLEFGERAGQRGASALIDLPGGARVAADIVWVRGNEAGVRFHRRFGSVEFAALGFVAPDPAMPVVEPEPAARAAGHWLRRRPD